MKTILLIALGCGLAFMALATESTNTPATNIVIEIPGVGTNSSVEAAEKRAVESATSNEGAALELLYAMVNQIVKAPASLLLIVVLIIAAWMVEVSKLPSTYIPAGSCIAGAATYWLFAAKGSVPPSFPHPAAVLFANGLICGFVAYALHTQVTVRILNWMKPAGQTPPQEPPKE